MSTITTPTRVFKMNTIRLQDPDQKLTPDEVCGLYAESYPHLAAATVTGPTVSDAGELIYVFEPPAVKTKGVEPQTGKLIEFGQIETVDLDGARFKYPIAILVTFESTASIRSVIADGECRFTLGDAEGDARSQIRGFTERLLQHAAELMHAARLDDSDYANCSFRSLPEEIQREIERRADAIAASS